MNFFLFLGVKHFCHSLFSFYKNHQSLLTKSRFFSINLFNFFVSFTDSIPTFLKVMFSLLLGIAFKVPTSIHDCFCKPTSFHSVIGKYTLFIFSNLFSYWLVIPKNSTLSFFITNYQDWSSFPTIFKCYVYHHYFITLHRTTHLTFHLYLEHPPAYSWLAVAI